MSTIRKIRNSLFKVFVVTFLISLSFYSSYKNTIQKEVTHLNQKSSITDSLSYQNRHTATKSRNSAVRLVSMSEDGGALSSMSGTYVKFLNRHYVLTVMHGLVGTCDLTKVLVDENYYDCIEYVKGDSSSDYMIMEVEPIHDKIPLSLLTDVPILNDRNKVPEVLEQVYYTGYPNTMGPFTVDGRVMGYDPPDGRNFYIFSYAWMGASGSGVFGESGKLIGYVIAIDVGYTEFGIQILEDVVMVGPIKQVDWTPVLKRF